MLSTRPILVTKEVVPRRNEDSHDLDIRRQVHGLSLVCARFDGNDSHSALVAALLPGNSLRGFPELVLAILWKCRSLTVSVDTCSFQVMVNPQVNLVQ